MNFETFRGAWSCTIIFTCRCYSETVLAMCVMWLLPGLYLLRSCKQQSIFLGAASWHKNLISRTSLLHYITRNPAPLSPSPISKCVFCSAVLLRIQIFPAAGPYFPPSLSVVLSLTVRLCSSHFPTSKPNGWKAIETGLTTNVFSQHSGRMRTVDPLKMLSPQSRPSLFTKHNLFIGPSHEQGCKTVFCDGSHWHASWRLQLVPFNFSIGLDWAHQMMKGKSWCGRIVVLGQFKSQVVHIEFDSQQISILVPLMERQSAHGNMESVLWVTEDDSQIMLDS